MGERSILAAKASDSKGSSLLMQIIWRQKAR
jgi:hypothetical protein